MAWAPSYATPEELRAYLRVEDTADDVHIGLALAGASRAIDKACRRQFGLADGLASRIYTAKYDGRSRRPMVEIDDLMTSVGLVVAADVAGDGGFATVVTDYALGPTNAAADSRPWTQLRALDLPTTYDSVRVTGTFGWSSVPEAVEQACLLQASRFLARRDSPYGIAGSPEAGSELRLLAKVDPDVAVVLGDYKRKGWVFA